MASVGMIANTGSQTLIWGKLLDKTKKSGAFVVIGEIVAGMGHVLMFWWHKYELDQGNTTLAGYTIIIGLGIIEFPWSMSNVGWTTLISEKTSVNERTKIISQLSIIGGLGGIFGATTGGFLYNGGLGFSNGNLFYIAAVVMILSGILVHYSFRSGTNKTSRSLYPIPKKEINTETVLQSFSQIPSDVKKVYIVFLIALLFINFGRNSVALITAFFLVDENAFSASDQQVAIYRNVSGIATMISGFLLGTLLTRVRDTIVLFTGAIFALVALLWLSVVTAFTFALISAALIGSAMVVIQASSYSVVAKIIPENFRGRLFAYYNAVFFLSWGIGATAITGPISDLLISQGYQEATAYRVSFLVAAFLVIVGIIVLIYAFRLINTLNDEIEQSVEPQIH
jgi:MFS family permease